MLYCRQLRERGIPIDRKKRKRTKMKNKKETTKTIAKEGISLGSVLALVISYVKWKSIAWAIFHSVLGWGYVLYFVVKGY